MHHTNFLNLKAFDEFVAHHHFKMDTLEAAVSMMNPGCFMATIYYNYGYNKYCLFCFVYHYYNRRRRMP